mmetsp:Transcript_6717/g.11969  ORF Transcript_6717/g.11969 Transcript_6717/m.11969 type:complete len:422 (+) Transcript_6717:196-1461(+)
MTLAFYLFALAAASNMLYVSADETAPAADIFSNLRGADGKGRRRLNTGVCDLTSSTETAQYAGGHQDLLDAEIDLNAQSKSNGGSTLISLGACDDFAIMAASTATCAGSFYCYAIGGYLAVSPGTSITGNFVGEVVSTTASAPCATDGLAAWKTGRAMTGTTMLAEMGGKTFGPGIYVHESSINIAFGVSTVYLDAKGDPNAQFIFNIGSTLTTSAGSKIVLQNGAEAYNVFWVLGTALTMGANSILVGNVLAGSAITMGTNAMITGRAIAQTAVTCETACNVQTSGRHSSVPTGAPTQAPSAKGVRITKQREAYGHHGACDGFNGCKDAATCALKACQKEGYSVLVSYGDDRPCPQFRNCHLFCSLPSCDLQYDWGNGCNVQGGCGPHEGCNVLGVTDIVCRDPVDLYVKQDGCSNKLIT